MIKPIYSGGVIYPIVFRKLQPILGFPSATRIIAFMALGTLSVSLALMRTRVPPPKTARPFLDLPAFTEAPFTIFTLGTFLACLGLYFPFYYATIYGTRILDLSDDVSFYLLPVLNAGSVFGRILPGLIADKAGSLNTIVPCGLITSVLAFAWLGVKNAAEMLVFCAMYGFFSGAIVSLLATVIALLSPDLSLVGTRMGMCFTITGLGVLIGNPIAGAILNIPEGRFCGAQVFSAVTLIAGAAAFAVVRVTITRTTKGWKC